MKFVIVTGMSGAGKSQAVDALEDIGFFCIDNLPPQLIMKFADLVYHSSENRACMRHSQRRYGHHRERTERNARKRL